MYNIYFFPLPVPCSPCSPPSCCFTIVLFSILKFLLLFLLALLFVSFLLALILTLLLPIRSFLYYYRLLASLLLYYYFSTAKGTPEKQVKNPRPVCSNTLKRRNRNDEKKCTTLNGMKDGTLEKRRRRIRWRWRWRWRRRRRKWWWWWWSKRASL